MSLFKSGPDLPPDMPPIPEEEDRVLDKFARWVVKKRLAVPAIMFIESGKPLNYIASQFMVFSEPLANPMLQVFFNIQDYELFQRALERRENVEILLLKIEEYDAQMVEYEKAIRKYYKQEKKKWKWYQRWLGIATPRPESSPDVQLPEFIIRDNELRKKKKEEDSGK